MPGWFVVSCAGTLVLSVCAAVFLVKKVYKNFSLEADETDEGGNIGLETN
jgi:uncharacterized membrane protein YhdT